MTMDLRILSKHEQLKIPVKRPEQAYTSEYDPITHLRTSPKKTGFRDANGTYWDANYTRDELRSPKKVLF